MTTTEKQQTKVHIRSIVRRDMPEVLAIEQASFEFPWSEKDFVRCLKPINCIGFVAEHDERVVGYMLYAFAKPRIRLLNLAVADDCRRQGIGRQLMQKLVGKLSARRRKLLVLAVREANLPGQLFFRRLGFRATGVMPDHYVEPPDQDAYVFEFHIVRETFNQPLTEKKTMTEKQKPKKRETQRRIEGCQDPPVEAVQQKAEEYAGLLRNRMETARCEDISRAELVELMKKHDVETCEIEDYDVKLVHSETDKIKVAKKKELG